MTSDSNITLYEYWRSSASYRLRIALNIKGLSYNSVAVNLLEKEHLGHRHKARDSLGRVPVLEINGITLTQSFSMLEYLEECYPDPPLLPKDVQARARVRALSLIIVADIHPLGNPSTMVHVSSLLSDNNMDKPAWQQHFIAQGLDAFESILAHGETGKFCHGDTPSLADCCLIPQLYNARRWQLPLDRYPRICTVEKAASELDSFQKAHPDRVKK